MATPTRIKYTINPFKMGFLIKRNCAETLYYSQKYLVTKNIETTRMLQIWLDFLILSPNSQRDNTDYLFHIPIYHRVKFPHSIEFAESGAFS